LLFNKTDDDRQDSTQVSSYYSPFLCLPSLVHLRTQSRNVLMTLIGGSWRTGCFSTHRKWKQCCVACGRSATRWTPLVEWKLQTLLSNAATIELLGVELDPAIRMNCRLTELVRSA